MSEIMKDMRNRAENRTMDLRLARHGVRVEFCFPQTYALCADYLESFEQPDIMVRVTREETNTACASVDIPLPITLPPGVAVSLSGADAESQIILTKIADAMPAFDTILMHGAVVELDGWAYMFTAPSGVGKTTRLMRWLEEFPDSRIINGDKPFIRIEDGRAVAYGSPWAGKERLNSNTQAPLRAIYLLERAADGEADSIWPLSANEAFAPLLKQTHRPSEPGALYATLCILGTLTGMVSLYRLRTSPTRAGVRLAYETANNDDKK